MVRVPLTLGVLRSGAVGRGLFGLHLAAASGFAVAVARVLARADGDPCGPARRRGPLGLRVRRSAPAPGEPPSTYDATCVGRRQASPAANRRAVAAADPAASCPK